MAEYIRAAIYTSGAAIEHEIEREKRILMAAIILCLLILPFNVLAGIKTGLYGILGILELLYLIVSSRRIVLSKEESKGILIPAVLLLAYTSLRFVAGGFQGAERLVQTAVVLLTLLVFARHEWTEARVRSVKRIFWVLIAACMLYWFVSGRATNYYTAFYYHSNGFAVVILAAIAVTLISCSGKPKLVDWLMLAICAVLMLFANSRSAMLGTIVMLLVMGYLSLLQRRGKSMAFAATVAFALVLVGAIAFSILYPSLLGTELGTQLELASREYLHKNFFSGRQVVWSAVLEAVSGHELFGLGLQMTPSMIYETTFSCHNLYLQTILQMGIVGLVLLLLLLWFVLRSLCKGGVWASAVGTSLLVAMLVHDCLEISLTQNNFDYGLLIWAIWGICLAIGRIKGARPAFASSIHQEARAS